MLLPDSKILVHEGAAFNLPDENAHRAALDIYHMVLNCCSCDIVIVLISGKNINLNLLFKCHLFSCYINYCNGLHILFYYCIIYYVIL